MSQSILPGNFSVRGLSVIERRRLEHYYEQYVLRRSWIYGEGHFILACYAALPVVLTSDLLYKLWLNFKDYWREEKQAVIHPVAPADLLLSPLVEEIGHELYEMPESIRQVLLVHLKEITSEFAPNPQKLYNLTEIAQFLHSYAQYDFTPANKNDDAFREAQIWTALSYLDPGQAFGQLVNKYKQAKDKSPDQLRYANALGNMSRRFMLDIVRDPALVPQAHKAVTALTSVVKDVFNDRDPARLAELQREIQNSDDEVLTDEPVVKDNVINIEIDEMVTAKLGGVQKKKGKGKLRALVVGLAREVSSVDKNAMNANVESATLFAEQLRDKTVNKAADFELIMLLKNNATKHAILDSWNNLITSADIEDDILFYVSGAAIDHDGHCLVACADTDHSSELTWLADEEIGRLANSKQVASVTMIIQTDHAGTDYWLDTKKDGNVVFASCKYTQTPLYYTTYETREAFIVGFTMALVEAFREITMQITNQALFVKALKYYADDLKLEADDSIQVRKEHSPVLLCNANSRGQFFAQGKNKLVTLQSLLRDTGFYNERITGIWDSYTAQSLELFRQNVLVTAGMSKQRYIEMLIDRKKAVYYEQPIFLFIFSDPKRELSYMDGEQKEIFKILSDPNLLLRVQVQLIKETDAGELRNFFINPANRNRIQMIYYSGYDKEGDFLLRDGAFILTSFLTLLEYQKNIQLFVSNTCRSEYFAEYVSMLGVPQTIGVKGKISDQEGADFGIELFRAIVAGGQLGEVRNLGRPYIARENGFILFKNDQDAMLPWKFKESVKKIRVLISYAARERSLVNQLKERIGTSLQNLEIWDGSDDGDGREYNADMAANSDVILVCISPRYVRSDFFKLEQEIIRGVNKPVIGIDLYLDDKIENLVECSGVKLFARLPGKFYPNHLPVAFSDIIDDLDDNDYAGKLYSEFLNELSQAIQKSLDARNSAAIFVAQNEFPSLEREIIGREGELLQIDERLSPELPLLLRGIVGMGKTTVAIAYCNNTEYTKKYNYIIWCDASEGILFGIAKALEASKEFRSLFNSSEYDQDSILPQLKTLLGNNLLVIDNANNRNDLLAFTNRWIEHKMDTRCLLISRCNLSGRGLLSVDPLSLADAGLLYRTFNQKTFQEEAFKDVYDLVNGNVLLLEILAKFANSSAQIESTTQLLEYLRSNASGPLFDDQAFADVALGTNLYKSANLDRDLEDLMRPLSLFPAREFSRQLFYTILGEQQAEKMEALIVSGWLEQIGEKYKIPFIVKELFRTELKPDAENCLLLVTRLIDLLTDQDIGNKSDLLTIGVSIVNEIGISLVEGVWMKLGKLQLLLGRLLGNVYRFDEGIDLVMRFIRLFTSTVPSIDNQIDGLQLLGELYYKKGNLGGSSHAYRECRQLIQEQVKRVSGSRKDELLFQLIIVYHKIGSLHHELKEYDAAIKAYNDALQLNKTLDRRGLMADWIIKLGIKCLEGIGEVYLETESYELALVSFEDAYSLLNKWGDFDGGNEIKESLIVKIKQAQDSVNKQKNHRGNFLSEAELFRVVERSGKLTAPDKPLKSLLLFQTEEKQTWLVATTQYVFIIIDDEKSRKSGKHIQRQLEKNEVLSIETKPQLGLDETSRIARFAARGREWSYSLSLFPTDEILLRALGELVADQKKKKNKLSDFQLKVPPAQYTRFGSNNVITTHAGKQEAFIVDRTLVCFAADVPVRQRSDVLDLLLLAQLVARKEYAEIKQAKDWHQSFTSVLTNIGCTIEARGISQFAFPGKQFRLEDPIMNMMANVSSKYNMKWFFEKSLAAVKSFSEKKDLGQAFKANTHSNNNAVFQVCLMVNTDEGPELNLGIALLTSGSIIETLFGNLSTENTRLDYSTLSCKVNEHLYADVRDAIIEKLNFLTVRYVMEIRDFMEI